MHLDYAHPIHGGTAATMRLSQDARNGLVDNHVVMAKAMGHRFRGFGVDVEDLEQEILIGLWEASQSFDQEKHPNVPFFAHARPYAVRRCAQAIGNSGGIALPPKVAQAVAHCRKAKETFAALGCPKPTVEQIAKATGYQVLDVEFALAIPTVTNAGDHLPDVAQASSDRHLERAIDELWDSIDVLKPSDRKILGDRHGLDGNLTLDLFELSRKHHMSVSQLKRRLDSIRRRLKTELLRRGFKPGRSGPSSTPVLAQSQITA